VVLRDAEGNYYVRVPAEQAAELATLMGDEEVTGYLLPGQLPTSQPLYTSPLRLSGFQVNLTSSARLRPLSPWLA
jgi:hypothetical protein